MSRIEILKEKIIPLIISKNKFGNNVKLVKFEVDKNYTGEDQYASSVLFVEVSVENHEIIIVKHSLVVKYELSDGSMREWMGTEVQFYNEIYTYEKMLPLLFRTHKNTEEMFPKFYYGVSNFGENRPQDDIIIVEDLRVKGFKLATEKLYLDYDHIVLALKQLGRFHALSYKVKQENPEEFFQKVSTLKETSWKQDGNLNYILKYSIARAFNPILSKNDKKQNEIIERFQRRLENANDFMLDLVKPSEPTAVFCHGDFCRNNVLFRYNENNKPIKIKFFDLATARYASPVIDLSLFLFLNTTVEIRKKYWNDFLNIYYDSLSNCLSLDIKIPTFKQIVDEMQEKGVYGFMHCSFFVPMVVNEEPNIDLQEICNRSPEERAKGVLLFGGEKGTKLISEIAQEMIDRGFIK